MWTRQEFFEWLNTCPEHSWDVVHDDEGHVRILFWFDEEDDDECTDI